MKPRLLTPILAAAGTISPAAPPVPQDSGARLLLPAPRELSVLHGHEGAVNSAAFSRDGKQIVTASDDHTAVIWDARTGQRLSTLSGLLNAV